MIIGMDVKRYTHTLNRGITPQIIFKRPSDTSEGSFNTYISREKDGNDRIMFEIAPYKGRTTNSMMGRIQRKREIATVKKIHRVSHATSDEMKQILSDASVSSKKLEEACDKVFEACDICASSSRQIQSKKVSLSHVNEAINEEIQADYTVVYIRNQKTFVLNIVDIGTRYGERVIAESRGVAKMMELIENEWLYHHGSPKRFSADP